MAFIASRVVASLVNELTLDFVSLRLTEPFGIEHTTIQFEGKSCVQGVVVCLVEKGKL